MDDGDDQMMQAGTSPEPVRQPSLLSEEALYLRIKDWFLKDFAHSEEWREQAKRDFDFVAGDQWEPDVFRRLVKDEKRVPITFNKTATFIKMVAGLEINGRHAVVFLPRGTEEGQILMNEDLNQASKWMSQGCDADDHQSEAFQDTEVCGMGWTESRLDYELDPDGMYIEEHIDPIEMHWDRAARKKNLTDAQRVARVRKMRLEDARALAEGLGAEDVQDEDLDASWAVGVDQKAVKPSEEIRLKQGPGNAAQEGYWEADPNFEVHIVQVQWWEREVYYRVAHPQSGQEVRLFEDEFKQLLKAAKQSNVQLTYARQVRKVYKQAFVGSKVLVVMDCPAPDRFTFQCMTGQLHRGKGTWFGLVKLLRDPQMWTNKLFSQIIHILNTTAKGGILAEKDAFPDIKDAQKTYARPDAITVVSEGAIQKGKIMQKPGVGLAAPFVAMMEYSDKAFYGTTGINIELMGMRGAEQPGILEAQRKQAGMTVLGTLFDARANHLKQVGRIRLHFIQNFLSDGRLMRIVGPNGYMAIRLVKDKVAGQFDVEVSDAPTSPDMKSQTWAMLMQLLPFFKGSMTPTIANVFLEYSPLPTKAVHELKQAMMAPNPAAQEHEAIGKAQAAAKIESEQARAEQAKASARRDDAASARDLANAILDIAQAGGQMQAQQAANVESMLLRMIAARTGQSIQLPEGAFAIQPQGQDSPNQLPTVPSLPVFGQAGPGGTPSPANLQQLAALLANARGAQAAANPPTMQ